MLWLFMKPLESEKLGRRHWRPIAEVEFNTNSKGCGLKSNLKQLTSSRCATGRSNNMSRQR